MPKIYLISPPKIDLKSFAPRLENALKTKLIPTFQLRLKNYEKHEIIKIAKELNKICVQNNCLFILNDFWQIALEQGFAGVHLGEDDELINIVRKNADKNFVIGASCYNSRHLAINAIENGANYVAFGAFFETSTKQAKYKATPEILSWANEILDVLIVAIGGINQENASQIKQADFAAVISSIWNHPQGEKIAIKLLHQALN
jgi:thiamine-phosphate pyrophosphorylase